MFVNGFILSTYLHITRMAIIRQRPRENPYLTPLFQHIKIVVHFVFLDKIKTTFTPVYLK